MATAPEPIVIPPENSNRIILHAPLRLSSSPSLPSNNRSPPLPWLQRTWNVTHSTLPMWRTAKNVRIAYTIIDVDGKQCLDDTVTNENIDGKPPSFMEKAMGMRKICGVDSLQENGGWAWKGKGWLKIAGVGRWEVLGWGEYNGEKWVVTWFEKTMFSPKGLDVYCDGVPSARLYEDIMAVLKGLGVGEVEELLGEMREVKHE
ncbi:hypothetical protein B0J14DRAFT_542219 [Halenospora varia]|nr:hypothetical protein B0J14DRAFT_542219 [Halenospora varia]